MTNFEEKRRMLVEGLQRQGIIKSENVANAFLSVKREIFMQKGNENYAYVDSAFPIGYGQTISQPLTIAVMLELLQVGKKMKVLEVGAGCGYVLSLLQELTGKNEKNKVFGIELVPELVEISRENLEQAGYENVRVTFGDGTRGFPEEKNFDRILISAACAQIPKPLVESSGDNGRIVAPMGGRHLQYMHVLEKKDGKVSECDATEIGAFVFVPLKGKLGWD